MGGGHTLNIAIPNLEDYAYIRVFSSDIFSLNQHNPQSQSGPTWEEQNKEKLDDPELKKGLKLLWFATCKDDFLVGTSKATVKLFKKHGFKAVYEETDGAHTWLNW